MLTLTEARKLVKLARATLESVLEGKKLKFEKEKKAFSKKQGVFVTLLKWPSKKLRGCIGFPMPIKPLAEAIIEAAKGAAFDPRFMPLTKSELNSVIIEISLLTEPQLIQVPPQDRLYSIEIGKDGLIVQLGSFSGLLLPQVAQEQGWNSLEFLRATCTKAGLPAESWLNPACKVYKFQAQIFREEKPKGKIVKVKSQHQENLPCNNESD